MIDSTGAWIVSAPGGVYAVDRDTTQRLSTGTLIAIGQSIALVAECDEELTCGYYVVDRASGDRRRLGSLQESAVLDPVTWWWNAGETISPDGQYVVLGALQPSRVGADEGLMPQLVLFDLDELTSVELGDESGMVSDGAFWTADSRFVFYRYGVSVWAYDTVEGEAIEVTVPQGGSESAVIATSFTMRPSERDGTTDGLVISRP